MQNDSRITTDSTSDVETNLGYPELALFALAVMTVIVFFLR